MLSCNDCLENGVVIKYVITINIARESNGTSKDFQCKPCEYFKNVFCFFINSFHNHPLSNFLPGKKDETLEA